MSGLSRRAFLATGAATATGAAIAAAPLIAGGVALHGSAEDAAAKAEAPGVEVQPSTVAPREPVMAFVRDEARGEVTVVAGLHETTYRDEALVKRLLAAAPAHDAPTPGGFDVITP